MTRYQKKRLWLRYERGELDIVGVAKALGVDPELYRHLEEPLADDSEEE